MSNDVKQAAVSQATQSRDAGASVLDMASNRMVLRRKLRHFYDQSASVAIAIGGVSVILAILLIFMYLFYEVLPLFESATLDKVNEYQIENRSSSTSLHLAIEEQSEIGMRIGDQADVLFFDVTDGATVAFMEIALPAGASIDHFALDTQESGIFALGLDNGEAVVARYGYTTTFVGENNTRTLTPKIDFPFGEQPYALFAGSSLTELAIRSNGDSLMVAGVDENGAVKLINATKQTNLFSAFDMPILK
jgi:phosphate transport system permease protein